MRIIGHAAQWDRLTQEVDQGTLPHAYLFYGVHGIGKSRVALRLAQYLMCPCCPDQQADLFGSMGSVVGLSDDECACDACQRVAGHKHPDLYWIEPTSAYLTIDTVRDLQQQLALTRVEAEYRVVIFNEAHKMTRQAANALLKTIEEPLPNTLFILLAPNLFQILPTIRSRCRHLYFSVPVLNTEIQGLFDADGNTPAALRDEVYQLNEGSIGLSLAMLEQPAMLTCLADLDRIVGSSSLSFREINQLVDSWVQEELDLTLILEVLKKKMFRNLMGQHRFDRLICIDRISQAQERLRRHVNKNFLLENLLLELSA